MPSTATLSAPTSPTSYDHLEKLLLCAEVVQYGETGQSFNVISSALKENPLLTASPNYDPGRLSGDTLRERWRDLVRDEGFGGNVSADGDAGSNTNTNTTTAAVPTTPRPRGSRVAMRNGMITSSAATPAVIPPPPPPPSSAVSSGVSVPIGEKAVRDLTRRMWESYQNMMKEQIQADERSIAQLLDEIGNLENERAREIEEMEAEEEERKREAARVLAEREATAAKEHAAKEEAAKEAAAKEVASREAAAAAIAAAAAKDAKEAAMAKEAVKETPKSVSPVAVEVKKLDEPFAEVAGQQQKGQHTMLRTTPPSPSKASLKNILSDEPAQSVPLERQTSSDRVGYDPIRDGARPPVASETPQPPQQRYPPIQPTEPVQGGYQIYEKPPASIRRLSGSGPRPQPPPEFAHHIPSGSPGRPPLTPTGPRIGTFPQSAQRSDMALSPVYPRHEHETGYSNGRQSPIGPLNIGPRSTEEARTPRPAHLPPSFSPTTPSYPQPHSSPSRPHFAQPLPSIHQLSPQRTPVQPPGYPAPMQRLPSSEYLPHHSPGSEHQPLHSPMGYNNNVPHSPFGLPHPSQSPRTPGFPQSMPPPQYSPTHSHYQNQYPHAQQSPTQAGFTPLQPAFSPQQREYPPVTPAAPTEDNRLPPINTPAQLPPLQFVTPKQSEQSGRPPSPIRPRPEEISPVLAPDDASAGVPDFPLDKGKRKKGTKGKSSKVEAPDEDEEATKTARRERNESVEVSEEKPTKASKGKTSRAVSKSRGTAASTRPRRGQSVGSVGSRTADPDDMDVDEPTTKKEESVAPEPIGSKSTTKKTLEKKKMEITTTEDESEAAVTVTSKSTKRGTRRNHHHHQLSASTEPEFTDHHHVVETPRDDAATTPAADPATPRPSFHLDMSVNATPTSSTSAVKKFAQRANPLLNNVSAHRYANLFMKPVDERLAPGYSRIVYKPQDIKSIRALIKAGAAQNPAGTPTLTPTPTADGPSMSFGTTPSTPTTSVANAPMNSKGAITNSSQLEKEIWRMFANAVMYNKSNSQVAQEAREMARDIGIAIDNFRSAERIGERKAAEAAKEKEKEKEKERRGRGRRGSLIKSEVFGEDESERGDADEEDEGEIEVRSKGKKTRKVVRGKKGKQDKDGDVEMEDKADDEEEEEDDEEEEESDKSADEESEGEEGEEGSGDEEDQEEEEEEEEERKPIKKGKTTVPKTKPKTTRAAAATAKGRGRKGSVQEEVVEDEPKGRGRGAGRTRAAKR
ncbi:hypothetical protein AOL_s00081g88 [Orbilia oligospora ATCC 24927]|uniref:Bromo domain-containing protein n=1 Tax=Arthrobotrys oligospora (strain ATCC 24927 / CBS 115.81 / DSM 1491) TaxID=756982 RepID=G1XFE6_ARTOA|nr:hypothetical protein AOL_s00081g88 [Orbilia oligospora ATCC 24927]EGX48092.1 hypothetical protein AOL_s00081g88 [Orbilia oligospora ATCC 24927]